MANPPDPSTGNSILFQDSLLASLMGSLSMLARLALSTEPVSIGWVVRRITAAAITASLVGLAIQDHITSNSLKLAVAGAAGYSAPECLDFILRYIKLRGSKAIKGRSPIKAYKRRKGKKA
jgi:hypothetical protein